MSRAYARLICYNVDVIFSIIGDNKVQGTFIFEQVPWDDYHVSVTYINLQAKTTRSRR